MNLKKLFHLNLSKKIILMATAIIVIFCIALIGLYQGVRSSSFAERQLKVQHQTETAWGVDTITAPAIGASWAMLIEASLVPGGRSTIR